jgi:hypothetical protein
VEIIQSLGQGAMLTKLDLKDAYQIIPVHLEDQYQLGISWQGQVYVERRLPFGMRSAPILFTAFSDLLTWAIHCQGVRYVMHYLDDFLLLGAPNSQETAHALDITCSFFDRAGIPVAAHKTEGPSMCLTFLGLLMDTFQFQLRLPPETLERLRSLITSWKSRKSSIRKDLESFVGHLAHAATIIRPGRLFFRSFFSLISRAAIQYYFIRLNVTARADLLWWYFFLQKWNGRSFFPNPVPAVHVYSDASGAFGCGAFDPMSGWFQLQWPASWLPANIAKIEVLSIVVAAAVWGWQWTRKHVCFHSHNMAVVSAINKCSAKDHELVHFIRCLYLYSAFHKFSFFSVHIPGSHNKAADALSRQVIIDLEIFFYSADTTYSSPLLHRGTPATQEARLDIRRVDQTVLTLLNRGIAPSTSQSYSSGLRRYLAFCTSFNLQP